MTLRLLTTLLACWSLATPAAGQPAAVSTNLLPRIDAAAARVFPRVVETRRDIHRHPELGFRETRTAALVADRLRSLGFDDVRTGVGGTGVVAVLKGGRPGPVVAVRADMDALPIPELIDTPYKSTVPGVKHACGHDAHVAVSLGVAEVLAGLRAELPGTVKFLFQPAEEGDPEGGTSGAQRMLEQGAFEAPSPEAIFGLHVFPTLQAGQIGLNSGAALASSSRFKVTVVGRKTHGAYPHTGLDPVPIASQIVMAFQTIPSRLTNAHEPTIVTVGSIQGGNRNNIIADRVVLEGTVRSLVKGGQERIRQRMEEMVKGITGMYGATYEFEFPLGNPVTYNDPALVAASKPVLQAVAGEANVVAPPPQMGAEDFSLYQQRVPGLFFMLGAGNVSRGITAMNHTEYFDIDEDAMRLGVRALSALVADYLARAPRR